MDPRNKQPAVRRDSRRRGGVRACGTSPSWADGDRRGGEFQEPSSRSHAHGMGPTLPARWRDVEWRVGAGRTPSPHLNSVYSVSSVVGFELRKYHGFGKQGTSEEPESSTTEDTDYTEWEALWPRNEERDHPEKRTSLSSISMEERETGYRFSDGESLDRAHRRAACFLLSPRGTSGERKEDI